MRRCTLIGWQDTEMESFTVATGTAINETELLTQAKIGDRNAFSELVCLHAQGVTSVIYHLCGDAQIAEDAAQETFIQAWLHLFQPTARKPPFAIGCTA